MPEERTFKLYEKWLLKLISNKLNDMGVEMKPGLAKAIFGISQIDNDFKRMEEDLINELDKVINNALEYEDDLF